MYTLEKTLPKRKRFSIYKRALEIYKDVLKNPSNSYHGLQLTGGMGLCLLLPSILWNLSHFRNQMPNGKSWDFHDTAKAFPEIRDHIEMLDSTFENDKKVLKRIEILEKILE